MSEFLKAILPYLNLLALVGGWLLYLYLKSLPEKIHQKSLKAFEFELNKELEKFKADFLKELEF